MDANMFDHYQVYLRRLREIRSRRDGAAGEARVAFAEAATVLSGLESKEERPTMLRRLAYPLLLLTVPCLMLGAHIVKSRQAKADEAYAMLKQRATDLSNLKNAVESYRNDHGRYPASNGFEGLYEQSGRIEVQWIRGLVPDYLPRLPRDPREDKDPSDQYLYNSNGTDYKIIAHHPGDCELAKKKIPETIDPLRGCLAYGYWSAGARDW
jgi:hypothetical protein